MADGHDPISNTMMVPGVGIEPTAAITGRWRSGQRLSLPPTLPTLARITNLATLDLGKRPYFVY